MRRTRDWITLGCCLFVMAIYVSAQTRKAGLWELTTTMTWQQSPFPAGAGGAPAGGGDNLALSGRPHTTLVCFTQEQIDKYGAILPPARPDCQIVNVVKKAHSMTADMVCTGKMSGKASMESSWTDEEHAEGKIHFSGSMQVGKTSKPIEWTTESTSFFKGAECGTVKPFPMPDR